MQLRLALTKQDGAQKTVLLVENRVSPAPHCCPRARGRGAGSEGGTVGPGLTPHPSGWWAGQVRKPLSCLPRAGRRVGWPADGVLDLLQDMYWAAPQAGSWAFYWLPPVSHPDSLCQEVFAKEQMFLSFLHPSSHPSIHPSSTHFSMCPSIRGSIHPLIHLSTHSFIHPIICSLSRLL